MYSLVKFGGVTNYLAYTWTPDDLAACQELNLPCADASHLLLEPLHNDDGAFETHDYYVITWLKPAVMQVAMQQGFTAMAVGELQGLRVSTGSRRAVWLPRYYPLNHLLQMPMWRGCTNRFGKAFSSS